MAEYFVVRATPKTKDVAIDVTSKAKDVTVTGGILSNFVLLMLFICSFL